MSRSSDSATSATTSDLLQVEAARRARRRRDASSFSAGTSPGRDALQRRREAEQHAGRDRQQQRERAARGDRSRSRARSAARRRGGGAARNAWRRSPTRAQRRRRRRSATSSTLSVSSCRTQPPAAGAEREAHGELAPPRRGPREQQVGDVRARDQQHGADDRRRAASATDRICCRWLGDRRRPRAPCAMRGGVAPWRHLQRACGRSRPAPDRARRRACSTRGAGLQPADAEEPAVARVLQQVRVLLAGIARRAAAA